MLFETDHNFLRDLSQLLGFNVKSIQTDNGGEFAADFHKETAKLGIKHCFNYVRKPIYNGKIERFNRTMKGELFSDPDFLEAVIEDKIEENKMIEEYLHFYNCEHSHASHGDLPPAEYVLYSDQREPKKSKMY